MRFFRTANHALYETIRLDLDAAWGLPREGQETCYTPLAQALRDPQDRVLLAVHDEFCELAAVAGMLPSLLASGVVEEITADTYKASLPSLSNGTHSRQSPSDSIEVSRVIRNR
jgi:hypothetical protein